VIVLDTHVIVWHALQPASLSARARREISKADSGEGFIVSDTSLWEIAMLVHGGRLTVDTTCSDLVRLISEADCCSFGRITPEITELSTALPDDVGADPADRLIAATAIETKAPLVTADGRLRRARCVTTIW